MLLGELLGRMDDLMQIGLLWNSFENILAFPTDHQIHD
jgi:hypothetical protein